MILNKATVVLIFSSNEAEPSKKGKMYWFIREQSSRGCSSMVHPKTKKLQTSALFAAPALLEEKKTTPFLTHERTKKKSHLHVHYWVETKFVKRKRKLF